jgi:hypothetical protein
VKGYAANVVARARFAPVVARPAWHAFERTADVEAAQPAAPPPSPRAVRPAARDAVAVRTRTPEPPAHAAFERAVVRVVGRREPAVVAAPLAPVALAPAPPRTPGSTPLVPAPHARSQAAPRTPSHAAPRARSHEAASSSPEGASTSAGPQAPSPAVATRIVSEFVHAPNRASTPRVDERTIVDERTVVIEREVEIAAASREIEQRPQRPGRAAPSPTIRVTVPPDARGFGGDVTAAIERAAREAARRRLAAQSGDDRPLEVRIDRVDVHVPAAPMAPAAAVAQASASNVLARSLSRF